MNGGATFSCSWSYCWFSLCCGISLTGLRLLHVFIILRWGSIQSIATICLLIACLPNLHYIIRLLQPKTMWMPCLRLLNVYVTVPAWRVLLFHRIVTHIMRGVVEHFFIQDTICVTAHQIWSDPDFYRVFRYHIVDGGGPDKLAAAISDQTLVVTSNVTDRYPQLNMSDARSLLNKEVSLTYPDRGYHRRIAAIAAPVRSSHFETSNEWGGAFIGHNLNRDALINDLGNVRYAQVSLRVSPDADHDFVDALMEDVDRLYRVGNVYLLDALPFSDIRYVRELEDVNEVKTQLCILFFLMLNIFLGVIGTFWFRTQHRCREVALRMAMGSSRRGVFLRLMGEGLLLLSVAAVPALLIAFNVGIAELVDISKMQFTFERFLIAAVFTWLLMALMIVVGIWYPAYKAMRLQPAEALHDE